MEGLDVVLGKLWLNKYNPNIDRPTKSMVIKTPNQEHSLLNVLSQNDSMTLST